MSQTSTITSSNNASTTLLASGSSDGVTNLQTNGARMWETLHESCQWGNTPDGGMNRLTLNDDDRSVREWFISQAKAIGCKVVVDAMGNIFAIREGINNDIPPIGVGSHLDTQPKGGRYDGIAGVLSGLEILRTLHENNYRTYAPIVVIDWTNEEGARFPKAMVSSGVWSGDIPIQDAYNLEDVNAPGVTFVSELERIGFRGETAASHLTNPLSAHFELHIEQGPILEEENIHIGIVEGVQGMRWFDAKVVGREAHTGTTPMDRRADALVATSIMIQTIETVANEHKGYGTVGIINSGPQSTNTIPGHVEFSIDIRHSTEEDLDKLESALFTKLQQISKDRKVEFSFSKKWFSEQLDFDPICKDSLRESAKEQGYPTLSLQSGAGHDSCYTSHVCPTAMLFIPCKDGISHNPAEYSSPEAIAKGVQVLIGGVLRYDKYLEQQSRSS